MDILLLLFFFLEKQRLMESVNIVSLMGSNVLQHSLSLLLMILGRTPLTGEPSQATSLGCLGMVWPVKGCWRVACFLCFCKFGSAIDCFCRPRRFGSIHGLGAILYVNNSLTLHI